MSGIIKRFIGLIVLSVIVLSSMYIMYVLSADVDEYTIENQVIQQEIYINQTKLAIQNFFEQLNHSLNFLTKNNNIIEINKDSQLLIHDYYESHRAELKAITRISAEGKIVYTYPYIKEVIDLDVSKQKHNAEIIRTQKPVISDVFLTVQGYRALVYAYPIFNNNKYDGCISLVIPFDFLAKKYLQNLLIGKTGTSFIISEAGIELYCSNQEHIGRSVMVLGNEKFKNEKLYNDMLKNKDGILQFYSSNENGEEYGKQIAIYKSVPIGNTFWSIAIIINESEILRANRGLLLKLTILFTLISFGALFFLYFYARQRRKSRKLINDKEQKYKANLEKLVDQRTIELKELNDSLKSDIIKRRQIERELNKAIEKVEKSEKIKSEFLAQMSHEIRTPVNTILSFTSLIKEELSPYADEELKYGFTGISSASKRLIRTIDLILNMSDIQLGTHEYFPKEIDICIDVLEKLIVEYRPIAHEKNLKISIKKSEANLKILGDSYSINQIFANLIDNAIKYTNTKGSITIECGRDKNDNLYVSVIDTGVGISAEYIPKLFEQFSQEDKGYTRKFEGNGLGLALVKKYCELNNAEILVESKKNIGTKFTVIFDKNRPKKRIN